MASEHLTENPLRENPIAEFVQKYGYVIQCEEYVEGLPGRFQSEQGLEVIRTGPILGWVRHPMGEDRMVRLTALLIYDPSRLEVRIAETGDNQVLHGQMVKQLTSEGWNLAPCAPDRVVGFKKCN